MKLVLNGDTGDIGPQGEQGEIGPEGPIGYEATVTDLTTDWVENTATITVSQVTDDSAIIFNTGINDDWHKFGLEATAQATDSITFTCDTTPTVDITFEVLIGLGADAAEVPIEEIKLNGILVTPVNKAVDITSLPVFDTEPTSAWAGPGMKMVILETEPTTYYDGWIYVLAEQVV